MNINKKEREKEEQRLQYVLKQIQREIQTTEDKVVEQKESLKEINKNMLSEFKFETESTVDLEGAAVLYQYQNMGQNIENAMEYQIQRQRQLQTLQKSAYFAKLNFKEEGFSEENIYIGAASLVDKNQYEFLIYDWRAPICSLFYDYEEGKVSYEAPSGTIYGEILNKRHFKITGDTIKYVFDSSINIMDDMLKEALAQSTDDKMKTIITTIQKEQNAVIRDESADVLVVSGAAGSGKTSIALHRIAYLLYKNRDKIFASDILIFTPNDIFGDYISHVLPELGETNADTITFSDYIQDNLGRMDSSTDTLQVEEEAEQPILISKWHTIETYYEQMEYLLDPDINHDTDRRIKEIKEKSTSEFIKAFNLFIDKVEAQDDFFEDIYYENQIILSADEIRQAYNDCTGVIKCSSRLLQVRNRLMAKIQTVRHAVSYRYEQELLNGDVYYTKREIKKKKIMYLKSKFKPITQKVRKMTSLDLLDLYNRFLKSQNISTIGSDLYFEDALSLLYMKGRLDRIKEVHKVKYVFIDEAQDYTLLHYQIIKLIYGHAKYTLLGDPNQSIHPYMSSSVSGDIEDFLGKKPKHIRLAKTYRSTQQINDFCNQIIEIEDGDNALREGKKPVLKTFSSQKEQAEFLLKAIEENHIDGYRSIAIIGKTKAHARKLYEAFDEVEEIGLLDNEEQLYKKGTVVIPSYLAKGLEFDCVYVMTDEKYHYHEKREKQLYYTVCTRALHELSIIHVNKG